jgi:PAS domain S-box-containing protein
VGRLSTLGKDQLYLVYPESLLKSIRIPNSDTVGRLPWFVRFLLGCCMAAGAVSLTAAIPPLRAFPLLLAFPTVILSAWFLGMWGAMGCALIDVALVDAFLTKTQVRFSTGNATQEIRLAMFLAISLLLGWSIRRLAQQRAELSNKELQQRLALAESEKRLAEEKARASEILRDREDMLQIALRASGMGLWVWDLPKGIVHRTDEVFRMVGCEPGAFGSEPEAWLEYVHPEDVDGLKEIMGSAHADGTDYHTQYRVVTADGAVRWLESQGKCQKDTEGKLARIVGVMADITRRKQTEEAMLRAEKLAVAGRLAASVAHEINNPLEAVANMLYLITLSDSVEDARRHASGALDELMRVSLIAQSTLKFHRQTGSPQVTILSEVLESVLTLFRGKLQSMEISVDLRTGREEPIACMPSETQQIFANLVANAIEAMQRNGRLVIRVRHSYDWRDGKTEGMRVTISDSGTGIDRSAMRRIFEPFFTTKFETGTGLGLWVVAQLVDRHKGSVHVWSSRRAGANGTTFSVFLPIGEINAADPSLAAMNTAQGNLPQDPIEEPSARLFSTSHKD